MKTIGLIGGMSWESTVTYYQIINKVIKQQLGGLHSAQVLLYSIDFHLINECLTKNDWNKGAKLLTDAAKKLKNGLRHHTYTCNKGSHTRY